MNNTEPTGKMQQPSLTAIKPALFAAGTQSADLTQMKSQLLAALSHALRTPLHSIVGLSGLLAGTALSEEQAAYVRDIEASCNAMVKIVADMRRFAEVHPLSLFDKIEEFWFATSSPECAMNGDTSAVGVPRTV